MFNNAVAFWRFCYNRRILVSQIPMRRLFVLFLVLMLPLQVFAGIAEDRLAFFENTTVSASESKPAPSTQSLQSPNGERQLIQLDAAAANDDSDNEDSPGDNLTDDFAGHATFGDDAVPASFLVFAVHLPDFISTLHNDAASIPPYLPPAARPPKI
jgi:hypothetical protein